MTLFSKINNDISCNFTGWFYYIAWLREPCTVQTLFQSCSGFNTMHRFWHNYDLPDIVYMANVSWRRWTQQMQFVIHRTKGPSNQWCKSHTTRLCWMCYINQQYYQWPTTRWLQNNTFLAYWNLPHSMGLPRWNQTTCYLTSFCKTLPRNSARSNHDMCFRLACKHNTPRTIILTSVVIGWML